MKHPIYTQTVEYFGEGNNITEYRPNWFEAVYQEEYECGRINRTELGTNEAGKGDKNEDSGDIQERGNKNLNV